MNLIGPSEMLQDVKDQSDSFYISYVRQVARKSKNMNLLAEFSWIFSMETAESEVQYNIEHMCKAGSREFGHHDFLKKIMHLCTKSRQKAEIFLSPFPRGKSCIFVQKNDMFKSKSSFGHFQRLI